MSGRVAGYAPIEHYAAIGDGRTVALVARDGAVDWLCLPDVDAPSVFAALLDAGRGGAFHLAPAVPWESERRYLPDTNVLETTFRTADGCVTVVDALTLPGAGLAPERELVRRIEGRAGSVPMRWSVTPRPGYATQRVRHRTDGSWHLLTARGHAAAVRSWSAGEPAEQDGTLAGEATIAHGESALLVLAWAGGAPVVLPGRDDVERRLRDTIAFWREWAGRSAYDGPWREMVVRSALALKLLVHAPTGAIAAAATTGLPEDPGGVRNWDYRASWIRDSAFTLDALLRLGHDDEARAFFWWLMHASQRTHPRLQPLYRLDGGTGLHERELDLAGYRGSRPVYAGNDAAGQLQLGIYGTVLETVRLHVANGHAIDDDTGTRMAALADTVCDQWRSPDEGIWEVRGEPRHFTHSKLMCWVALDRALTLAQDALPGAHARRWRRERERVEAFLERECYAPEHRAYVRAAGADDLDAAVLIAALAGYPHRERLSRTVDRIRAELGDGPLVYRYRGDDGLPGEEATFLPCAFWLVGALARLGRADEAADTMEALLALANDVGLYAEEAEPGGVMLGNFPQGLTHLALINAAAGVQEAGG